MPKKITIGDIEADPGSKAHGFIKVADVGGISTKFPVMIVNGSKEGPTLCVTAGIHATEYPGIFATMKILNQINPKDLSGVLVGVPIVNTPSFPPRTQYVCAVDGLDINSVCPGKPDGSLSYLIAYKLFREVISRADYLIDLHGGDFCEKLVSGITIFGKTGKETIDKESEILAKSFPTDYVWVIQSTEGKSCREAANNMGIPAIVAEAGGSGELDQSAVAFHIEGLMNVMKYLKMIDGSPIRRHKPKIINKLSTIKTISGGFFVSKVKSGDTVSKGKIVGEIYDPFGVPVEKLLAPIDGVVILLMYPSATTPGSNLMFIGAE